MAQEDPPKGIEIGNSSLDPTVIQKQKEYYSNPQYNEDGTIKMKYLLLKVWMDLMKLY